MVKIKSFSKSKISFPLPSLIYAQKESWKWFWEYNLKELFEEMFPIYDYTKKQFEISFKDYKLGKPKYKDGLEARINNDSYEAPLRVNVVLHNLKTNEKKQQELFLADFPLMTEKGTFVVNGVERVVISQLIRSPGVFFTLKTSQGRKCFGAKVIPSRGSWLEFETESSGFIGVRINRERKIAATTLLRAFGVKGDKEIKEIFSDIDQGEDGYIEKTLKRDIAHNESEAFVEIYKKLRPGDLAGPDAAKELILNMFCNFQRYDISRVGRWKIYQRLQ